MTQVSASPADAREKVREAMHKASPFVVAYARVGYAAKGVVYVLVGLLAALAVLGAGNVLSSRGAMATLVERPFGRTMLGAVALGILGYCLWQFIRAIEDPENEGSHPKGIGKRLAYFLSGVLHFGLVLAAVELVFGDLVGFGGGAADDTGDRNARDWTAWSMSFPFGRTLVGGTGLGIAGYGMWKLYRAWIVKLDRRLALDSLSDAMRRWVVRISRFGIAARGVVFVILGILLVTAALQADPGRARGVGGALAVLEQQPYGPFLLGTVALGLVAYGVYEFVRARYRRIDAA